MTGATIKAIECPTCGRGANLVKPVTLRSVLRKEFVCLVREGEYRFCGEKNCDTVYFGEGRTFTKESLAVSVGVKETFGERPLCYCFGHSVATIAEDLLRKGRSDAVEDTRRRMKEVGCSCELKNPSGSCCLASLASGIAQAAETLATRCAKQPEAPPAATRK
jgi:Zinc binding domain